MQADYDIWQAQTRFHDKVQSITTITTETH